MRKIIVYHASYGCDTGCCGHVIEVDGENERFVFAHSDESGDIEWAKDLLRSELGPEHVADLDWENCEIVSSDDCPS